MNSKNLDFRLPPLAGPQTTEKARRAKSPNVRAAQAQAQAQTQNPAQVQGSGYAGLLLASRERHRASISRPKSMSKLGMRRRFARRQPEKEMQEKVGGRSNNMNAQFAGDIQDYVENEAMTQEEILSESLSRHLADIQQIQADLRSFKEAKLKTPIFRLLIDSIPFPNHVVNVLRRAERSYAHIVTPKTPPRWPSSVRQRYQQTPKREQTAAVYPRQATGVRMKSPTQGAITKNAASHGRLRQSRR
jgi:hypothetical protein